MKITSHVRALAVSGAVIAMALTGSSPASAVTIESGATSTSAHFNPYQGCWVRYHGNKAIDRAVAYDEYATCESQIGARMLYQPNAPVGVQVTSIKFGTNYAETIVVNDFRQAKGSTKF